MHCNIQVTINKFIYYVHVCSCFKEENETPTKEEYEVAKFLRFNIPAKQGKLMGMDVQYFLGKLHPPKLSFEHLRIICWLHDCTNLVW